MRSARYAPCDGERECAGRTIDPVPLSAAYEPDRGCPRRSRTADLRFVRARLFQLSYRAIWSALRESNSPLRVKSPLHDHYAKDGIGTPWKRRTSWCDVRSVTPGSAGRGIGLFWLTRDWRRRRGSNSHGLTAITVFKTDEHASLARLLRKIGADGEFRPHNLLFTKQLLCR